MPAVSVIMPAFNRESYVDEAIQSVMNQSFRDFELIVVDDCSTDSTLEKIRSWVLREPDRIRLIAHDQNRGVAAARNTAIANSRTNILMFADTDDVQEPERLEVTYKLMLETSADVVMHDCEMIDENGLRLNRTKGYPSDLTSRTIALKLLERNYFWTSLALVRKSEQVFFDPELPSSEDFDLFLRMAIAGNHFEICSRILTRYRVHRGNLSANGVLSQTLTRQILSKLDLDAVYKQLSGLHGETESVTAVAAAHMWRDEPEHAVRLLEGKQTGFEGTFTLAVGYYKIKQLKKSFDAFERLITQPTGALNAAVWNNLAVLSSYLGYSAEQTERFLNEAVRLREDYQDAVSNLRRVSEQQSEELKLTERPLRTEIVHKEYYKTD